MKRTTIMMVAVSVAAASGAVAQNPPPMMRDSVIQRGPLPMVDGRGQVMGPEELRMRIEERWAQRVQSELGLNDQQMDRLRTAERANQDRHRDLSRREEDLHHAVMEQLQPGVAANGDSLSRSLEALGQLRVQQAQSDVQLLHDLSFLTPVQRARYFIMARALQQRIEQIRFGFHQGGPMARPMDGRRRMMMRDGGPGGMGRGMPGDSSSPLH